MMRYANPKGTFDILPDPIQVEEIWKSSHIWSYVEKVMAKLAHDYAYREIRTPIFEQGSLFTRSIGETSDIISKEMYSFSDKGNRLLCLRPEGTAPVMRAFAQHQLQQAGGIQKLFYIGPFFRYDRPQAGRYRQFHQFGVEAIGDGGPEQDFETIDMLMELHRRLGLSSLRLLVNSLGTCKERMEYKKSLLTFLTPHFSKLTKESQHRFEANPLRILDSKDPEERALLENAPSILDSLGKESQNHFHALCKLLEEQKVPFQIEPTLVRGLDYYNHTVFELISDKLPISQNALGGGGRYDGLLPSFDGPDLPSIGFSIGIERLLHVMLKSNLPILKPSSPFVYFVPLGEKGEKYCFTLLYELRHKKIPADMGPSKKLNKALQLADKSKARFAILIGDEEIAQNKVQLKSMQTREESLVSIDKLISLLTNYFTEDETNNR